MTGNAGFLGSHLCDRLINGGHEVICLNNFFTGKKNNIAHLLINPNFGLMHHDVIQPIYAEVDWIFNLACPASLVYYQRDPVRTIKINVMGVLNSPAVLNKILRRFCKLQRPKSTAIQKFILSQQSIRLAFAPDTTRASALPRLCSSTTTGNTSLIFA